MLDKKRLGDILKHMEKTGRLPYGGNGLCNVIKEVFGGGSNEYAVLVFIGPDDEEKDAMENVLCRTYWGSELSPMTSSRICDKATSLRKTIVALMIAMADD